jgi:acyl carrier protein
MRFMTIGIPTEGDIFMDKTEIFEKIRDIIVEQLGIEDPDSIQMDTSMTKDLEADSLYVIEVIMAIEEEFDIEIPDEEAEKFTNVEDIVNYVAANAE